MPLESHGRADDLGFADAVGNGPDASAGPRFSGTTGGDPLCEDHCTAQGTFTVAGFRATSLLSGAAGGCPTNPCAVVVAETLS